MCLSPKQCTDSKLCIISVPLSLGRKSCSTPPVHALCGEEAAIRHLGSTGHSNIYFFSIIYLYFFFFFGVRGEEHRQWKHAVGHTWPHHKQRGRTDLYSHLNPAVKSISSADSGIDMACFQKQRRPKQKQTNKQFYIYLHNHQLLIPYWNTGSSFSK